MTIDERNEMRRDETNDTNDVMNTRAMRALFQSFRQPRPRPWDENTCALAAFGGHFDTLKWARENGCPWDEDTRELAAEMGYVET